MSSTSLLGLSLTLLAAAQASLSSNQLIAGALLPLPEQLRAHATVVRLDGSFRPEVLRKGTNGMVCIADAPNDERFDVRCYRDTFVPVVYRAFQLGYQVSGEKVEAEIKAGKLRLSSAPTAGYRCLGAITGYDPSRNAVTADVECWQSIHFPFRTAAEIGFPDEHDVPRESAARGPVRDVQRQVLVARDDSASSRHALMTVMTLAVHAKGESPMKRMLVTIMLPVAMVAVSSCGTSPQSATSAAATAEIERAVTQIENDRVPALLRGDTAFIERVYADDYVVTGANGVVRTRPQVIADMKSGVQTFESMKNDDVKVRAYGDTAIVTGRTTQKGQYKGQPSLSPTLFTRVYVKQDGEWHLVANSSSAYLEVE